MKIQDLLLEMNYIDEKYIEECDAVPEKKKTSFRRVRFALIAAVVAVLLAVTAFAAYELTLTKVGDKSTEYRLVKVHEEYDEIDLSKSGVTYFPDNVKISDFKIGYIPEGFEQGYSSEREQFRAYNYTTKDNSRSIYILIRNTDVPTSVDNEHSVLYKVESESFSGYLNYDEEDCSGTLVFGDSKIAIIIMGNNSKEEIVKIAESITYEQK